MSLNLAEQYYLKAKDNYPYCMEEAMEQLNYALAYDPEHAGSNYLMGMVYWEQMDDLVKAEQYFELALASDPQHKDTYLSFASMLIRMNRYKQAKALLSVAAAIAGTCMASVQRYQGIIYERMRNYDAALVKYNKARLDTYNEDFMYTLDEDIKRTKAKQEVAKNMSHITPANFEQISLKVAYVSTIGK